MSDTLGTIASPFVPELDLFTKSTYETKSEYIMDAIGKRLAKEVVEKQRAYIDAVNRYEEIMRLIRAYRECEE